MKILHQDDLLHPEYLANIEKAILRYPLEPHSPEPVLYSGKQYAHNYLNGVIANNHIHRCPCVTTSRKLLLNECTYRKEAGHIADDDLFLRVGAYTDVIGISYTLASFRIHPESTTAKLNLLSFNLATDYVFQIRYYKEEQNTLLDNEDIAKLNIQAVKFINLFLFQTILLNKKELIKDAFRLREEFDKVSNFNFEKILPIWAKLLWRLSSPLSFKRNRIASVYVFCLNELRKVRDLLRDLLAVDESKNNYKFK